PLAIRRRPVDAEEGTKVLLLPTITDHGADDHVESYRVDWGDGTVETHTVDPKNVAGTLNAVHTYADGPAAYHAAVTLVTQEDGAFPQTGSIEVNVHDVPPTMTITGTGRG